jgi:atypical dual specificity phosphatase
MGSKSVCESALATTIKSNKKAIVDKCNVKKSERDYLVKIAMLDKKDVQVVYFDCSADECIKRVKNRVGHPSINFGRGDSVVKSFDKQLEKPSADEGFQKIITIVSFDESNQLLLGYGCSKDKLILDENHRIIKFPRTHHIFGLEGTGVTRDDLILDEKEIEKYLNCLLVLEEKVDGANLGISINEDYKIVYQNRSHYVTYATSTQFKGLQKWEQTHSGELFQILEPNRHIIYGEWCYAKHSIHYTDLPNYFIAFDIFDKKENKFVSRKRLVEILKKTTIPVVPIIDKKTFTSVKEIKEELIKYLDTKSRYRDGPVEGIYIRKNKDGFLERRCKIVRPDFIQGIEEHWMKSGLIRNTITY